MIGRMDACEIHLQIRESEDERCDMIFLVLMAGAPMSEKFRIRSQAPKHH